MLRAKEWLYGRAWCVQEGETCRVAGIEDLGLGRRFRTEKEQETAGDEARQTSRGQSQGGTTGEEPMGTAERLTYWEGSNENAMVG